MDICYFTNSTSHSLHYTPTPLHYTRNSAFIPLTNFKSRVAFEKLVVVQLGKVKFALEQAMKVQRWSKGIALLFP